MDIIYKQLFDFRTSRAKKLYNSSYLEELTGLIDKAASCIDDGTNYYFESKYYLENTEQEPNNSYTDFIEAFTNSFMYSSSDKVHIIRGKAGVGKTLFFNKGIQKLIRDSNKHKDKYIKLGVDFKNIDPKKDILFYRDYIYDNLRDNAIDSLRQLGDIVYKDYEKKNKEFCGSSNDTPFAKLFPVKYFCKHIYAKYKKPAIIILDNIDLSCVVTQKSVFKATSIVCEKLHDFMNIQHAKESYRVYFAMRPETFLHSDEMKIGKVINFPLPNIKAICLETIKKVLLDTAKDFDKNDKLKCDVTYYNIVKKEMVVANTFTDVAKYFNEILSHYLNNLWNEPEYINRLGTNQEFHCNIVNYNVRTFLSFLVDTLSNGGFKPLTKEFNENPLYGHYTVFDYIEMIIRGRWIIHPGNKYIDGEGGNKAPIIFNVFDISLWRNTQADKVKHFMLYVHVLQYLNDFNNGENVLFSELEEALEPFYKKEYIKKAVQELTFVRILYSFFEGDENIASKQHYEDVVIDKNTPLGLSQTGKFYIEKFICEFEYIYQMSLSSLMPSDYVNELKDCWQTEKELTVLRFLTGVFNILKDNFESFNEETLEDYINTFCLDDANSCKPYRRMLDSYIIVLNKKIQRATIMETKSLNKLKNILLEAEELQKSVIDYFNEKLGD